MTKVPVRPRPHYIKSSKSRLVVFEHPSTLRTVDQSTPERFEVIDPIHLSILVQLEAVDGVETQLSCLAGGGGREQTSARRRERYVPSCSLNIIIYGLADLEDGIGRFLSQHQMYLQDPIGCEQRLSYRNPISSNLMVRIL